MPDNTQDKHHLLFQRRHYTGVLSELRHYPYCVVSIPKNTLHRRIHEYLGDIPAPRPIIAKQALDQLRMLERFGAISDNDDIEKRLTVLIALFECVEQPTADALKYQLSVVRKYRSPQ
jgi:hypothetical protein